MSSRLEKDLEQTVQRLKNAQTMNAGGGGATSNLPGMMHTNGLVRNVSKTALNSDEKSSDSSAGQDPVVQMAHGFHDHLLPLAAALLAHVYPTAFSATSSSSPSLFDLPRLQSALQVMFEEERQQQQQLLEEEERRRKEEQARTAAAEEARRAEEQRRKEDEDARMTAAVAEAQQQASEAAAQVQSSPAAASPLASDVPAAAAASPIAISEVDAPHDDASAPSSSADIDLGDLDLDAALAAPTVEDAAEPIQ
jgi:hypothetical protein